MSKTKTLWCCTECGHAQAKWTGSCVACKKWNTMAEEVAIEEKAARFDPIQKENTKPLRLKEIQVEESERYLTKLTEFDRILGGGIVRGSLSLIGGDPGIGKSTLMLQISEALAKQGLTVLYISGEESLSQTSLRARRLGVGAEGIYFYSETEFSKIRSQIEKIKPDILIIDSIQILYKNDLPSAPGTVSQVRELATSFLHLSKGLNIATFLIGHVTKSGEIAGPKVLEHIVDAVLDFEGERHHGFRMLRSMKNRFGPTDEIAIFQMGNEGLIQVDNPSLLFIKERMKNSSGSAIVPSMEGSRSLLVEVQALVAPSSFSTSTRKSAGLDQNRLSLLLAVLEKRMGYHLYNADVFVSVAGGLKITEPALDLGVLLSIASSFCNKAIDAETAIVGEVGLSGEVRSVSRIESRMKEAIHLGFSRLVLPQKNIEGVSKEIRSKIELIGVDFVEEAIHALIS